MKGHIGIATVCLLAAVLLLGIGMAVPVHFRSVSPLVLAEAGEGTETLLQRSEDYLASGHVGLARLCWEAPGTEEPGEGLVARYRRVMDLYPKYEISGGPSPYFELFLDMLPNQPRPGQLLPLLLPRERRQTLLTYLRQSSNVRVLAILESRDLIGWNKFLPVHSAGGHPLDAVILTTALLEQSGAWHPELSRGWQPLVTAAVGGDRAALAQLEDLYIAVLALGNRAAWTELEALALTLPDRNSLLLAGMLIHGDESRFALLAPSLLLARDPAGLLRYLQTRGDEGWLTLRYAVRIGQGALEQMVTLDRPLYEPPQFLQKFPRQWQSAQATFQGFAQRQPQFAMITKNFLFLAAGYMLALALFQLITALLPRAPGEHSPAWLRQAAHFSVALGVFGLIWTLIEPRLLEFELNTQSKLSVDLASLLPIANTLTSTPNSMFDQVTLIVLLMFFVVQLMVFFFCMIKIREIRALEDPASTKIRLLDNEDNLFDLGLYVGLGGTVGSLVLVVLNLVDASLMAAYASTLFGIIFVAFLKVVFLRPYRRQLILEIAKTN